MRSGRSMTGVGANSRALVAQGRPGNVLVRKSNLAVIPPRRLPVPYKARRPIAKLALYCSLAAISAFGGYAYRDPDIRRAIDYRLTLLVTAGISNVSPTYAARASMSAPLPAPAMHLFAEGQKGPRADKFASALRTAASDSIERALKDDPLPRKRPVPQQTAAIAGAELFLTAFAPRTEPVLPEGFTLASAKQPNGEWAGLMKNASLSPEQPRSLFGGLTEDEFRARELRCMATAIYFEARDEPVKGQIAVAQVIMNRIRSPFYPKTICGVVYQGERNRHGCQFSFTCTGKHNSVKEKPEWATSVKLAKQVIAGEVWLDDVGYATHYHATYVHPPWRHELDKICQIGGHIFYKMKPGVVQVALLSEGL
jgi:spore germination cell wall hydrolase CwlJ-like protein